MNVNIIGEKNNITVVMLPGLGIVSPVIYYKPFVETLADKYKIITVEPFGYGLSDLTKEERNNKLPDTSSILGQNKYNKAKSLRPKETESEYLSKNEYNKRQLTRFSAEEKYETGEQT